MGWAANNIIDFLREGIQPGVEHAESYLEELYERAKKESQRKKSEAADRGTIVHAILAGLGGDGPVWDRVVQNKVDRAREWIDANNIQWSCVERPVYSRRYQYSGRFDGLALWDGKPCLFDWKTGKNVYAEFRLQTAAYVHAYEEEFPLERIEQRIILHLTEEACIPHYYPREKLRGDFNSFLGAQRLHNRIKQIEKEERK